MSSTESVSSKTARLGWLDALRGFTMILVVAYHVDQQTFLLDLKQSSSMQFWILMRMPLFFFVSGFLAYKVDRKWNLDLLSTLTLKKLKIQVIPTIIFFVIAHVIMCPNSMGQNMIKGLHDPSKHGYWFTIVLLYMFVVYYLFSYLESKLKGMHLWPVLLLWIVSLLLYESMFLPRMFFFAYGSKIPHEPFVYDSSIVKFLEYFNFFVFGNIVRRYWGRMQVLFNKNGFCLCVLVMAFLSSADFLKVHLLRMEWASLSRALAQYSLLVLVFLAFRHYSEQFSKDKPIGKMLQHIGTRTLDIYLLHFLFLPYLPEIGKYFNTHSCNFITETTASVLIALLVVAFCLLTSSIIRISPFLQKHLFGR